MILWWTAGHHTAWFQKNRDYGKPTDQPFTVQTALLHQVYIELLVFSLTRLQHSLNTRQRMLLQNKLQLFDHQLKMLKRGRDNSKASHRGQGLGWRFSSIRLRMADKTVTSQTRCLFDQQWPKMGKDREAHLSYYASAYNRVDTNQPPQNLFISSKWYLV